MIGKSGSQGLRVSGSRGPGVQGSVFSFQISEEETGEAEEESD